MAVAFPLGRRASGGYHTYRTRHGHGVTHEPSASLGNPGGGSAAGKASAANTSIRTLLSTLRGKPGFLCLEWDELSQVRSEVISRGENLVFKLSSCLLNRAPSASKRAEMLAARGPGIHQPNGMGLSEIPALPVLRPVRDKVGHKVGSNL
jgi:hypothetical protein